MLVLMCAIIMVERGRGGRGREDREKPNPTHCYLIRLLPSPNGDAVAPFHFIHSNKVKKEKKSSPPSSSYSHPLRQISEKLTYRENRIHVGRFSPRRRPLLLPRQIIAQQAIEPVGNLPQLPVLFSEKVLHDRMIPTDRLDLTLIVNDDK